MELKCKINNIEHDKIVSGATFSEEFNETLDSGSIIISHVQRNEKLSPYDDVFIYNADSNFNGYINKGDIVPIEAETKSVLGDIPAGAPQESYNISEGIDGNIQIEHDSNNFYIKGRVVNIWKYFCFNFTNENASSKCKYNVNLLFDIVFQYETLDQNNQPVMEAVDFNDYYPGSIISGKHATFSDDLRMFPNTGFRESIDIYFDQQNNRIVVPRFTFLNNRNGEITSISISPNASIFIKEQDNSFQIILKSDKVPTPRETILSFLYRGDYIEAELTGIIDQTETHFTALFASSLVAERIIFIKGENDYYYAGFSSSTVDSPVVREADDVRVVKVNYLQKEKSILPSFYKHMLVDNYTEEQLTFGDNPLFKYKISLFSETKGLEKTILPNVSITQSIFSEKRSCLFYLKHFVEFYSPKIKKQSNIAEKEWEYVPKYRLDLNLSGEEYNEQCVDAIFGDVPCPEMSLTSPTLREILSRIMIVKDCIPVVKDDIIYAMKIGETKDINTNFGEKFGGEFNFNPEKMSFPVYSMNSSDYASDARREYSGAISQKNTARYIEYLGFRNSDNALLTLDNIQIETRFPIYKINKLYLCYYKLAKVTIEKDGVETVQQKVFMCKHDITDLVLQNSVRNALSADWTKYPPEISNREDMNKYRVLTLGYDIGSKTITGWGTKYSYVTGLFNWFTGTKTYIENILDLLENTFNLGTENLFLQQRLGMLGSNIFSSEGQTTSVELDDWETSMIAPGNAGGVGEKIRSIFFQMDYNAMYDGTVLHSKDNIKKDDIITSDNCSSALTILEVDGLFEKEKMNRIGNKTFNLQGRYFSFEEMQQNNNVLGSVFDDNIVIYHREYAIYNDYVQASFTGTYDYVMKNYFTTVFAKLRTYNFMSYEESTLRSENEKWFIDISTDECLFERNNLDATYLLSAFNKTITPEFYGDINTPLLVNGGYFTKGTEKYYSDFNSFICGNSLCFNIQMFDNVTHGVYISTFDPTQTAEPDAKGSAQEWYIGTDEPNDAFIQSIGCFVGHFDRKEYFYELPQIYTEDVKTKIQERIEDILKLPKAPDANLETIFTGDTKKYCKDNKEILNITFQFEPISYDKSITFSPWLMRLSDLATTYNKFDKDIDIYDYTGTIGEDSDNYVKLFYSTYLYSTVNVPHIILAIKKEKSLSAGEKIIYNYSETIKNWELYSNYMNNILNITLQEIVNFNNNNITVKCNCYFASILGSSITGADELVENINFEKIGSDDTYNYYSCYLFEIGKYEVFGYYNGKLVFNIGVDNLTTDNYYYYDGYTSSTNAYLIKTYPQTMYILDSTEQVKNELVYNDIDIENLPQDKTIITVSDFNDVFSVGYGDNGVPYINVNTETITSQRQENSKSLQYWFKDEDGLLKFVFGVNIDKNKLNKKIYLSLLKKRSEQVYDAYHNPVAHVVNYLSENDSESFVYGEGQKYKENE